MNPLKGNDFFKITFLVAPYQTHHNMGTDRPPSYYIREILKINTIRFDRLFGGVEPQYDFVSLFGMDLIKYLQLNRKL